MAEIKEAVDGCAGCIYLAGKFAKETGLQVHNESPNVQKTVEHSTKRIKKGLQDCSYIQYQSFMTLLCAQFISTEIRCTVTYPSPTSAITPPLWMMLKVHMYDCDIHLLCAGGRLYIQQPINILLMLPLILQYYTKK